MLCGDSYSAIACGSGTSTGMPDFLRALRVCCPSRHLGILMASRRHMPTASAGVDLNSSLASLFLWLRLHTCSRAERSFKVSLCLCKTLCFYPTCVYNKVARNTGL